MVILLRYLACNVATKNYYRTSDGSNLVKIQRTRTESKNTSTVPYDINRDHGMISWDSELKHPNFRVYINTLENLDVERIRKCVIVVVSLELANKQIQEYNLTVEVPSR